MLDRSQIDKLINGEELDVEVVVLPDENKVVEKDDIDKLVEEALNDTKINVETTKKEDDEEKGLKPFAVEFELGDDDYDITETENNPTDATPKQPEFKDTLKDGKKMLDTMLGEQERFKKA